jgi:hypothetical protein
MLLTEWNTDDAIKVRSQEALEDGIKIGEQRGIKIGEQRGIKLGEQRGIEIGEQRSAATIAAQAAKIAALEQLLARTRQ